MSGAVGVCRGMVCAASIALAVTSCGTVSEPVREDSVVVESGELRPAELSVGDCIAEGEDTPGYVKVVPCESRHAREVFHLGQVEADAYERDELDEQAQATCGDSQAVEEYAGSTEGLAVFWYIPTKKEFGEGERFLVCALRDAEDATLDGPLATAPNQES